MSYECPYCGAISHNPKDKEQGFCGRCKRWAADFICQKCGFKPPDASTWLQMCKEWRASGLAYPERHYILDEQHRPIAVCLLRHALFCADFENRRVAESFTELFRVSTVFLGLDHQWGNGPPILFETMVFDREPHWAKFMGKWRESFEDHECERYASWDDAVTGHKAMLRRYLKKESQAAVAIATAKERAKDGG